uniref:Protein zyg-11 homolog B-like n=1 Tax=Saccoglossus kowalevskii TaxID=10224 RepID=A0ABM0GKC3_SACKO|nr:PREDICTED: protein zyg-11 homolog B-like [Saccoglossus kowalevskii]
MSECDCEGSPDSLQELCLDYISHNLYSLCTQIPSEDKSGFVKLSFKDCDIYFHRELSEELLQRLSKQYALNDAVLSLFANPKSTRLKRAFIKNAVLSYKGLKALSCHRIIDLDASWVRGVTVNDIIGALGEWTTGHLQSLNVSGTTFVNSSKFCIVISLSMLKALRHLNVSYTEFNNNLGLELVIDSLCHLESLDISHTPIVNATPLIQCRDRLKYLSMFQVRVSDDNLMPVITQLDNLLHLDISREVLVHPFTGNQQSGKFNLSRLMEMEDVLPNITYLDISGRDGLMERSLQTFLRNHPGLKFLGLLLTKSVVPETLAMTDLCAAECLTNPNHNEFREDLKITGETNEKQILEALRRYSSRANYMHKTLCTLFDMTQSLEKARVDMVQHILPGMASHRQHLGVQMAASACLYNLSKQQLADNVHVSVLKDMVQLTMDAMETFPNHQQLQKNALLTLCSDRILQDVSFDRFRAARLVMDCLCTFEDASMSRMAVAICSILAAKISTEQTALLGSKPYMKKLLGIVKRKAEEREADVTLKFTLSALWNLTDESPTTCNIFLSEGGLELLMHILEIFPNETALETKVLGLINNIAEVKELRHTLLRNDFIHHVKHLLEGDQIEVSYFAAGIVAHITCSVGPDGWTLSADLRQQLLQSLNDAIRSWENPKGEMVAYRSFSPFFPLLAPDGIPEVQLWAVWAIHHVCTKNGLRYSPMLIKEGGVTVLERLLACKTVCGQVRTIGDNILQVLQQHLPTTIL